MTITMNAKAPAGTIITITNKGYGGAGRDCTVGKAYEVKVKGTTHYIVDDRRDEVFLDSLKRAGATWREPFRKLKVKVKAGAHSEAVQNHLFSLGYRWYSGDTKPLYTDRDMAIFTENDGTMGRITGGSDLQTWWKYPKYQEVTVKEKVSYTVTVPKAPPPKPKTVKVAGKNYLQSDIEAKCKPVK